MNRRWIIVPIVAGALAVSIAGGTVLAHGGGPGGARGDVAGGVATILGIDQAEVEAAFSQAATEHRQASLQGRLDNLVSEGRLTQEQADEYMSWFLSRPEGLQGPGFKRFNGHGLRGGSGDVSGRVGEILGVDGAEVGAAVQQAVGEARDAQVRFKLDQAVEDGRLTQEQADQRWEQYQTRADDDSPRRGFGRHHRFGGQRSDAQPPVVTPQSL